MYILLFVVCIDKDSTFIVHLYISEQTSYISTVENSDLLSVDASITGGIPFLFPGVEASVTGEFEMKDRDTVSILKSQG